MKKYNWDGIISVRFMPDEFAKTLAKIAHGLAVSQFGLEGFVPLATELIRCKTNNWTQIVGGRYINPDGGCDDLEPVMPDVGHTANFVIFRNVHKRILLACQIRLFASVHSVTYHVIVGEINSLEQVALISEKIANAEIKEVSFPFS